MPPKDVGGHTNYKISDILCNKSPYPLKSGRGHKTIRQETFCIIIAHTLFPHAQLQTLLEAAVLTLVTCVLVHDTLPARLAQVVQVLLHGALEEAFTSLTAKDGVVIARTDVPADHTRLQML